MHKQIFFTGIRLAIAICLLVYLGTSGAIHWPALRGLATAWPMALTALAVYGADVVVTSWRLCVLLRAGGFQLSLRNSARLTLIGSFFNLYLPGAVGGDLIKIYYATAGNHGRKPEVATIVLLDRMAGLFAMLTWPVLAMPFFPQLWQSAPALRIILGLAVAAAVAMAATFVGSRIWAKLPLGRLAAKVLNTLDCCRRNPRASLLALAASLVAHTLSVTVMLLLARAIDPAGFSWAMAVLIPLGFVANTLPLTPGGLGVGEAAFDKLFALAGLQGGAETLIGWRMLTILAGLAGLVFYLQGRKRFVHERASESELEMVWERG